MDSRKQKSKNKLKKKNVTPTGLGNVNSNKPLVDFYNILPKIVNK